MDDVVESCKNSPSDKVHKLKPLTQEKSMELFCKKVFQCHNCPKELKKISSDFVEKCKGLPLAIVAIGGLLSKKEKTPFEWEKIRRSLSSEMDKNPHLIAIKKILGFSYDDLPYYLKSCLLYFGVYPEDYEVKQTRLIRQWIAEGFVKDEEGKTLEDIAQQYLTELIGRSLVQVSSFSIDGKAKSCRVHDLLHDMILRKFKELSFCQHISKEDESMSSGMIRRLSTATISNDLIGSTESLHTRSLLVFAGEEEEALTNNFVQRIPTKYRLLKVLDFENSSLNFVPKNWGNLAHLKYLNLRDSLNLTQLPQFIGKLQNLETLDLRGTSVKEMPEEICKLRKLRHLLVDNDMALFQLKNGLGGMTSLQTLRYVNLTMDDGVEFIRELGKLKQLRNILLTGVKEEQGSTLCSSINQMTNLEKLSIFPHDYVIDLPVISSLPMLRNLWLNGKLKKFPEWVPQLQSLVKLSLTASNLTDDPLKSLQSMSHLLFLELEDAYEGENLYFQDGGFKQLRELSLQYLLNLKSIIIDKGALRSLEKLQFWRIPELKTVPTGIQHLDKLEVLDIRRMSTEFEQCIAPDGGPEHPVIQHVPLVEFTTISSKGILETHRIHHSRP
ncbi:Disease resistance protein RPM1 [Spatholobus suberectus]|nr:Disease resistance protein RPM1 [Spatholobus suberectus]